MEGDLKEMMRCMCDGSHVAWRLRLGRPTDISKQTHLQKKTVCEQSSVLWMI